MDPLKTSQKSRLLLLVGGLAFFGLSLLFIRGARGQDQKEKGTHYQTPDEIIKILATRTPPVAPGEFVGEFFRIYSRQGKSIEKDISHLKKDKHSLKTFSLVQPSTWTQTHLENQPKDFLRKNKRGKLEKRIEYARENGRRHQDSVEKLKGLLALRNEHKGVEMVEAFYQENPVEFTWKNFSLILDAYDPIYQREGYPIKFLEGLGRTQQYLERLKDSSWDSKNLFLAPMVSLAKTDSSYYHQAFDFLAKKPGFLKPATVKQILEMDNRDQFYFLREYQGEDLNLELILKIHNQYPLKAYNLLQKHQKNVPLEEIVAVKNENRYLRLKAGLTGGSLEKWENPPLRRVRNVYAQEAFQILEAEHFPEEGLLDFANRFTHPVQVEALKTILTSTTDKSFPGRRDLKVLSGLENFDHLLHLQALRVYLNHGGQPDRGLLEGLSTIHNSAQVKYLDFHLEQKIPGPIPLGHIYNSHQVEAARILYEYEKEGMKPDFSLISAVREYHHLEVLRSLGREGLGQFSAHLLHQFSPHHYKTQLEFIRKQLAQGIPLTEDLVEMSFHLATSRYGKEITELLHQFGNRLSPLQVERVLGIENRRQLEFLKILLEGEKDEAIPSFINWMGWIQKTRQVEALRGAIEANRPFKILKLILQEESSALQESAGAAHACGKNSDSLLFSDVGAVLKKEEEERGANTCLFSGLTNMGNTCFVNSALKLFAQFINLNPVERMKVLDPDIRPLRKEKGESDPHFRDREDFQILTGKLMENILGGNRSHTKGFLHAFINQFKKVLSNRKDGFGRGIPGTQMDAAEFLTKMMDILDFNGTPYLAKTADFILRPGEKASVTPTQMSIFPIAVLTPKFKIIKNIQEGINLNFEKREKVSDVFNEKSGKNETAEKGSLFLAPPSTLFVQLIRTGFDKGRGDQGRSNKISDPVDIPSELDIKIFDEKLKETGTAKMTLKGVVIHQGNRPSDGHYYAYLKNEEKGEWSKQSDGSVFPLGEEAVKKDSEKRGYIALYELLSFRKK